MKRCTHIHIPMFKIDLHSWAIATTVVSRLGPGATIYVSMKNCVTNINVSGPNQFILNSFLATSQETSLKPLISYKSSYPRHPVPPPEKLHVFLASFLGGFSQSYTEPMAIPQTKTHWVAPNIVSPYIVRRCRPETSRFLAKTSVGLYLSCSPAVSPSPSCKPDTTLDLHVRCLEKRRKIFPQMPV